MREVMSGKSVESLFQDYKKSLIAGLNEITSQELVAFVEKMEKLSWKEATLFIMGNGGSAATATHFANDLFSLNLKVDGFKLQAECLSDNVSILTALGNDLSFDDIFVKQLEVKAKPGDALLILSASGNSSNLVKAAQWAKETGHTLMSITGFDGGRVHELSDFSLHIPSALGEYEKSEDLHLFVNHFLRYYFQMKLS